MRIILIYPPPWKIPLPNEAPDRNGQGPPRAWRPGSLFSGDEITIPYGLLSLAAQAKQHGHAVTVLNLYAFAWSDILKLLPLLPAELYGLSCFTQNRRGALALAEQIRRLFPAAHIVLGGPHAGALPLEILRHCAAVDSVIIGEGETTFMELIERLQSARDLNGLAGSAYRSPQGLRLNEPRRRIDRLDDLVSPYEYVSGHIFLSSRGCPGQCTFCGSPVLWGPKVRFHSAEYSLQVLEKMVRVHGKRYLNMKDDTFTADRKRLLQICRGIVDRGLNFLWSCDTRVDYLDEEILAAMRKAGCQLISLGVESGSPEMLQTMNKHTTPDKALAATRMLKSFGFTIRFYMIAAGRGETAETLQASLDFIDAAKPNQYLFSFLTLCPGTVEFDLAVQNGRAGADMFFERDDLFFLYQPDRPYEGRLQQLLRQINSRPGVQPFWEYSVAERRDILTRFSGLAAAHMDLAKAYYLEGDFENAGACVRQALDRGFPLPGLGLNYLACMAARQNNPAEALQYLEQAQKMGANRMIRENLEKIRQRLEQTGPENFSPSAWSVGHEFEDTQTHTQPIVPAPITFQHPAFESGCLRIVPQ
ncbi:MAG: radical SAM protein [Desulfobacteraceae bacterium]|nr:MAG: radical SAM protein [Desulfobacteraceae bacterium]